MNFEYKRTPAPKGMGVVVEFENKDRFFVPAQVVADDRDIAYFSDEEDTIGFIIEGSLDHFELTDWLSNNMNWEDVEEFVVKLKPREEPFTYEDGWGSVDKDYIKECKDVIS